MEKTFTISAFPKYSDIKEKCDKRLIKYLDKWQLKSIYEGSTVNIPGFVGSSFDAVKYFQVIKKPGDPFYREDQRDNEIGMTLWAHWPGFDHECEVNLFISGRDVLSGANVVHAEILKCGGAAMKVYWNNKLITDFASRSWFCKTDKVWIHNMNKFS